MQVLEQARAENARKEIEEKGKETNEIEEDEVKNKKYPFDDRKKDVHLLNIISLLCTVNSFRARTT